MPSTTRPGSRAVADLRDRAAAGALKLITGEDWAAWLHMAARFPGQSFTNLLLIAAQRPAATVLAGYEEWQARGRQVRKREPGIQLIAEPAPSHDAPTESSGKNRPGQSSTDRTRASQARLTYVWDIAQTTAAPGREQTVPQSLADVSPGLWDALTWLARREGFAVGRFDGDPVTGQTSWSPRRIRIPSGLGAPLDAWALIHELGHVLAHGSLAAVPGATTARCSGVRKVDADSIAFIVMARLGLDMPPCIWPSIASWAGSDPRAHPDKAVHAAGERITRAAGTISAHLDAALFAAPPPHAAADQTETHQPVEPAEVVRAHRRPAHPAVILTPLDDRVRAVPAAPTPPSGGPPPAALARVLLDTERFYRTHLNNSWAPDYLESRGFGPAITKRWPIGYAPGGWTTLTDHLRHLGYDDVLIEAAGLTRRSSRGTLIDHFRDRVMLSVRDGRGMIAGFIGRASPNADPAVPKYLNSPETSCYTKGSLLYGLSEARSQLTAGAIPVIAEGPFDAVAVTIAGQQRYVGLAPCGTALTSRQVDALATLTDLDRVGVLMALDGDRAGRAGTVKAYQVLLPHTSKTLATILPVGHDPAEILQTRGPAALAAILDRSEPLARIVIDAHLDQWAGQLDHAEGQLAAMRSAAQSVASTLSPETAGTIQQITSGRKIETLDEDLHPILSPELPVIARILPANAGCQIVRIAELTGCTSDEVTAEVANAVRNDQSAPMREPARPHGGGTFSPVRARKGIGAGPLAQESFPESPVTHARPESRSPPLSPPSTRPRPVAQHR